MKKFILSAKALLIPGSKRYYAVLGSAAVLCLIIGISAVAAMQASMTDIPNEVDMQPDNDPDALLTIQPVLLSNSSSTIILGTILSNETANIYPRREGIVEDIYVDIGDTVQKNQVVALLLPRGVEGQSAAQIAEKNARKVQAEADYLNAMSVAEDAVNNSKQSLEEKRITLYVAKSEQEALLRKFDQYEANVFQMLEQAFISVRSARQMIERILLGSNAQTIAVIGDYDIHRQLGLLNPQIRYEIIPAFTTLQDAEDQYLTSSMEEQNLLLPILAKQANNAILSTNDLLASTPTVPNAKSGMFTQQMLTDMTNNILIAQNNMLKSKEKWQDAQNAFDELTASEPDLYNAWKHGEVSADTQSNKVKMLTSQLQTSEQSLQLIESQQQQMVDRNKNMVGVANAMFNAELSKSGHRKIRSPFTGTISKRFIEVGQIVMQSKIAFELTDVPTSLADKAKAEIQFGLPEHLRSSVNIGDFITFFLPNNENELFEAEVTRKSPQVDIQTRTVTVQAKVDDNLSLPHHTSVRVRIVDQVLPLFQVPSFAVKRQNEGNILWVLNEEDIATTVSVTVRSEDGEFAEINGDITEDSRIVLDPPDLISAQLSND